MIMRQSIISLPLVVFMLLTACSGDRHTLMQQQLAALQAMNQADSVLTDDSLAQALAEYFDSHGTPNEQMEAHYLLGRTYADMGEAPAALAAYHNAIDRADTTAADCNFRQLCRVYAQMANVFYQQGLMHDFISCLDQAVACSDICKDTLMSANLQAYKMAAYERMNIPDSVIATYEVVKTVLCNIGYRQDAAAYSTLAIGSYLQKGMVSEAWKCIVFYESESGFISSDGSVEEGKEAYYNLRGRYHLAIQEYDSAYYYFRKELTVGKDFNNQYGASKGLAMLFSQTGQPDSAAIYALYNSEMNDSVFAQLTTEEVERFHQLYNYTRHKDVAIRERTRADFEKSKSILLIIAIFAILTVAGISFSSLASKRKKERKQYLEACEELDNLDQELMTLKEQRESIVKFQRLADKNTEQAENWKEQEEKLLSLIDIKEKETEKLKSTIASLKKKSNSLNKTSNKTPRQTQTYAFIQSIADKMTKMSEEDWETTERMISDDMPEFYQFITKNKKSFGINGCRICILLSQSIRVKEAAILMGVQPPYISKVSSNILRQCWGITGSSKELKAKLDVLCPHEN